MLGYKYRFKFYKIYLITKIASYIHIAKKKMVNKGISHNVELLNIRTNSEHRKTNMNDEWNTIISVGHILSMNNHDRNKICNI